MCTEGVRLPEKAHPADAGYDVFLLDDVTLEPGERKPIPSGFSIIIQKGSIRPSLGWARQHLS